ncbi:MAG: epoxyqueuosine reductase QueH [Deltaproteobacteria bacterium]|jgi:predicted adenine nucleotide alpha hydrolase (AANH) superfamily ATPase|nr:epoxyqueuosine reductase QueH [Deltaproteobacteria bacterium]
MEKPILLHACCGPCSYFPLKSLLTRDPNSPIVLFFYNPNIQPIQEYYRRRDSLAYLGAISGELFAAPGMVKMEFPPYKQREYLDSVAENIRSKDRCRLCYRLRLRRAAQRASSQGFKAFSSTLLYSRQQKHEIIKEEGEAAGKLHNIEFHYEDFRVGHKEGQSAARTLGLYRQSYCGCVFEGLEEGDLEDA